jgi:hypothetical protein
MKSIIREDRRDLVMKDSLIKIVDLPQRYFIQIANIWDRFITIRPSLHKNVELSAKHSQ